MTVRGNIVPHKSGSDHVAEDGKANPKTETPLSRTSSKPAKSQQQRANGRESYCTTTLTDSVAACNMESIQLFAYVLPLGGVVAGPG